MQEQSRVRTQIKHLKSRIQTVFNTVFICTDVLNMEGMRNRSNLPSSVTANNTRVQMLIPIKIFTMRFQNITSVYRIKQFIIQCIRVTWLFCQLCECMCSHLQDSRTAAPSSLQGSLGPQTMFFFFKCGCQSNWILCRTCWLINTNIHKHLLRFVVN